MTDPFADFKAAQREGWKLFAPLEMSTTPAAAKLVTFSGVREGHKVLDVACGTGVVAVTAACRGATVNGLDLTPALLERARQNALLAGVSIEFIEGDVEKLPFKEGTFDAVLSQFGHIFAPRPSVAVGEMLRVLRPGGVIAFSTWPPDGFIGKMFALVGQSLPPPPQGAEPPVKWGDPNVIRERLGQAVTQLTFDRERIYVPGLSPRHVAAKFEETAAPVIKVVQSLQHNPSRLAEFRKSLEDLAAIYFAENQVHQDFLMARAIKVL